MNIYLKLNSYNRKMIKGKYKVIQTIKENQYKRLERCTKIDGTIVVLKSYSLQEGKLAQNQVVCYQKMKQANLNGFPEIKEAFETEGRAYLVLEELGNNIDFLRLKCGGRLGLKTVLMVGLQILDRLEYLHKNQLLHGDVKPSNFMVGKHKLKHKIYLSDFQFSSPYIKNGKHIAEEIKERFSGSFRFSSRAANSKSTISRRDELESWLYSLVFLLNGELPWMQILAKNMKDANEEVLMLKTKKRGELLAGLPEVFGQLMGYIDDLKFQSPPDYAKIRGWLQQLMKKNGYDMDYKYDWQYL